MDSVMWETALAEQAGHAELLRGERALLERIVRDAPLSVVLTEMAEAMERLLPGVLVSVLVADTEGRHLHHGAAPSLPDFYNEAVDGIEIGDGVGSCGTAAYRRARVIATDIANDFAWVNYRELAARAGVAACWSTPLLTSDGILLGTFAIYHRVPRAPQQSDVELSAAFARTAGLAIERYRIREARSAAEAREKAARDDLGFIVDASAEIGRNLDEQQTMERLAGLVAPTLVSTCVVHVGENGLTRRVAWAGTEVPPTSEIDDAVHRVLATGRTEIGASASYAVFPLSERDQPFGTLTLLATAERPIDARTIALAEELSRRAAVSANHARQYAHRVRLAHDLQAGLLLRELPDPPGAELATSYSPAGTGIEVGGDFYDVFPLDDERWAFIIGDVCGRGARAASTTGLVRHTTRAVARLLREPADVVEAVNAALLDRSAEHGTSFVTLVYGQFRPTADGLAMDVLRAGHLPPLVRRADASVEEIEESGAMLGVHSRLNLTTSRITLRRGDSLVLVTDGVTEARNRAGELFGEQRLVQTLAAVPPEPVTPHQLIDVIGAAVEAFAAEACDVSDDDCASLIITAT